jgi:hypothetical protein
MNETDSAAIMFMALCKQGRADEALRLASEASFPDLIMGLTMMADACDDSPHGQLDRDFIMRMERYLLNEKAGRPMLD